MSKDFLVLLPARITSRILNFLPFTTLAQASRVCKAWRKVIDSNHVLWSDLLKSNKIWFGGDSERAFAKKLSRRRRKSGLPIPGSLSCPHPYKILFKSRHLTRTKWIDNSNPRHISFPAHGHAVVTCLIFSHERIVSAADDHSIHVYSPYTGQLTMSFDGHSGGVWALSATKDVLVSGSTDRTVRIWDLNTGRCIHVFGGHTSTVRCLAIVKPEWVERTGEDGVIHREKWPKRPMIVTGSRDRTLRVWLLPRPSEAEYKCFGSGEDEEDLSEVDVDENPYHKLRLEGHEHAVRALAARGRTLVSGSYDTNVRVWDIITGECKWILTGHTGKVYSVVLDPTRNIACSGSMDGTVRVWDLNTGTERFKLTGHTSLVGLVGISPSHLASGSADSTLRTWDPDTGEMRHTLSAHTGAITCFQHDEFKVLTGSDGILKMWDIRNGSAVRDLIAGVVGIWQVAFEGRWCVAASNRQNGTVLDVWDFGAEEIENEDGTKELREVYDWVGEPPSGFCEDVTDDEEDEKPSS